MCLSLPRWSCSSAPTPGAQLHFWTEAVQAYSSTVPPYQLPRLQSFLFPTCNSHVSRCHPDNRNTVNTGNTWTTGNARNTELVLQRMLFLTFGASREAFEDLRTSWWTSEPVYLDRLTFALFTHTTYKVIIISEPWLVTSINLDAHPEFGFTEFLLTPYRLRRHNPSFPYHFSMFHAKLVFSMQHVNIILCRRTWATF